MAQAWWKEAVVYQIYPSSFLDTNGDGWGDIKGISSKVDYLKDLGVDIVWISPIFKSPQKDMGYDIADYKAIDERYGTVEDVDNLIVELRNRGMKLMLDLVVNHTSDEHPWFLESRSSLSNPKRSWYIWKKPCRDSHGNPLPPNNWAQILGEANSAWTYDASTDEYFLSLFTHEQPDLNWENPEVRAAVYDVMHFWLKRGICGYRMDVINLISKDQNFPDAEPVLGPEVKYHPGSKYYANGPRMHEYLQELKTEVLAKHNAITVGEMPWISDVDEILRTVKSGTGELNMIFIMDIVDIDNEPGKTRFTLHPWTIQTLGGYITKWQKAMAENDGWNSIFCENHDNPRSVSRYTNDSDEHRTHGAKLLALLQTTLSGTLYIYQGEELGMKNMPADCPIETHYKDIEALNFWKKANALYGDDPPRLAHARRILVAKARDHARTPMQWDDTPNAGFCPASVTSWMRVVDDYKTVNARAQMDPAAAPPPDPKPNQYSSNPQQLRPEISVRKFWQLLLSYRKTHADAFIYGTFEPLTPVSPSALTIPEGTDNILAYTKTSAKDTSQKWLVILNFSSEDAVWNLPDEFKGLRGEFVLGNYDAERVGKGMEDGRVFVKAWEGLLARFG